MRLRGISQRGGSKIEVCVLASGSDGNSTYVRSGSTAILVDCGISCKELRRRLTGAGARDECLSAILLSHDHFDHARGIAVASRRFGVPVFANRDTSRKASLEHAGVTLSAFTTGRQFEVGDLSVTPFAVPHDAADPVGFTISDGSARVGIATDLGSITLEVLWGLSGCDAVMVESNHDRGMLMEGPYPWFLKKRVDGPSGHLSNDDAASVIESVCHEGLRHIVLVHISRINNDPALSIASAEKALGRSKSRVGVSVGRHDRPGELIRI